MVVLITSARLSNTDLTNKDRSLLEVLVNGTPHSVVAKINGYTIPLFHVGGGKYTRILYANFIGNVTNETIYVYAFDDDGISTDSSLTITSDDSSPVDPANFAIALIESDWSANLSGGIQCPKVVRVWDIRAVNKAVDDYIVVIEGERQVEMFANGYYKSIDYPLILEVNSREENRAKWILKGVQNIMEKYHGYLDSPHYDYIIIKNAGKNVSSVRNYRYLYNISLFKNYVRLGDMP